MRSLVALVLLAVNCHTAVPDTSTNATVDPPSTFRVLKRGSYGKDASAATGEIPNPRIEVAANETEFHRIWTERISDEPAPSVDFARESVVFLLLGSRTSGGYSIEPARVESSPETARVHATVTSPRAGSMVTMALTSPYAVLAVAQPGLTAAEWIGREGVVLARSEGRPRR